MLIPSETPARIDSAVRLSPAPARPSAKAEFSQPRSHSVARVEACTYCMGTIFNVVAYGVSRDHLESGISEAFAEAKRLDSALSNYRPTSELSRINRLAPLGAVTVSSELFCFLSTCLSYSAVSEGAFDITVGPLLRILRCFYEKDRRPPAQKELHHALEKVSYKNVILDERNTSVRFAQAGVELDPGGIGKGLAVDKMTAILKYHGIRCALISAGGSTIYALGAPPNRDGWKVTIKDPYRPSRIVETVELSDTSISTSGNYEKSAWSNSHVWGHIIDPRTGTPAKDCLAVSVIAPQALDSEAWAKPYCILGRAWTEKHKPSHFQVFHCEGKPDNRYTWI